MIDGRPVIFSQVMGKSNGCQFYRVLQPSYQIIEQDLLPLQISKDQTPEDMETWIDKSDVIFTQMAKSQRLLDYMRFCRQNNIPKKFVIDYDDNIFSVSPYNPAYQYHGIQEVDITMANGEIIKIRDGENGFDIEANKKLLINFGLCLKLADLVVTPSPILSGFFRKFNRNTKVIKNFLDFRTWYPIDTVKDHVVRIGYQGGWSHFIDWFEVKDALEFIMNKHKHVSLVIMGQHYNGALSGLPKDRVQIECFEEINAYPWKFKALNIDIGIAPLHNDEFSVCKSEIKWTEYSALEIPCIASNIPPYSMNINHGQTGFLCRGVKDWVDTFEDLIASKELRVKIGKQARKYVLENYDISKQVTQYSEMFESLFKPELIVV